MAMATLTHFASLSGVLYARNINNFGTWNSERAVKYDNANTEWDYLGTGTSLSFSLGETNVYPRAAAAFSNYIYMPDGGTYSLKVDSSGTTSIEVPAYIYLSHGGYLWRATTTAVYYSNDGSTWSSAITVASAPNSIRGMAGMERDLYVATDDALYRVAPGDMVEGVMPWGSVSEYNGRGMINHQGMLYIPLRNRILRVDPSGAAQDIWLSREADMPLTRIGNIGALCSMNNWLIAAVNGTATDNKPTVWAYQDEGWHHIATLPGSYGVTDAYYDRGSSKLWIGTQYGGAFYIPIADYALNPYTDSSSRWMTHSWLETDRFHGGQLLLDKDWESVTIIGDNLSTDINVKVYWQDADSTAWELLGTADSDGEELRWSTYATRPNGKWIKLGLLLQTDDPAETPRLRAVVVKFLPMVNDRIRDTVTISLHDNITFPDGTRDGYTRSQQWTHIDSMIRRVPPLIYQDPFGTQYEVKVTDWNMNAPTYNSDTGSGVIKEMEVTLVLEQLPDSTYA